MEAMFPVPKKAVIIKNTWKKRRVKERAKIKALKHKIIFILFIIQI